MTQIKKKGFTIVELVIVIAVIAILAAVLIPTFSSVIKKAEESNAMQAAQAAWKEHMAEATVSDPDALTANYQIIVENGDNDYYFYVTNGVFDTESGTSTLPTESWSAGSSYVKLAQNAEGSRDFTPTTETVHASES